MSQRPINERDRLKTRAALWEAIRMLGSFTATQLRKETRCESSQVREYLLGLTAAGILTRELVPMHHGSTTGYLFTLVKDIGIEPPRVRRDGTPVTQGLGREQMWRTMKSFGVFNALDLSVQASTEEAQIKLTTAKEYCHYLALAGYLAVVHQGKGTGKGGKLSAYRLIRNTGPLPPMIQRVKSVYDPNTGTVEWSEEDCHDQR
jgi:hypothetical protein